MPASPAREKHTSQHHILWCRIKMQGPALSHPGVRPFPVLSPARTGPRMAPRGRLPECAKTAYLRCAETTPCKIPPPRGDTRGCAFVPTLISASLKQANNPGARTNQRSEWRVYRPRVEVAPVRVHRRRHHGYGCPDRARREGAAHDHATQARRRPRGGSRRASRRIATTSVSNFQICPTSCASRNIQKTHQLSFTSVNSRCTIRP